MQPQPQPRVARAFPQQSGTLKYIAIGFALILLFVVTRNLFNRDYDRETAEYYKSIGRPDLAEAVSSEQVIHTFRAVVVALIGKCDVRFLNTAVSD